MSCWLRTVCICASVVCLAPCLGFAEGPDYSGQDLRERDLRTVDLEAANLEDTNLTGADLREANLKKANLKGANLTRASFNAADLTGADLRGADFTLVGVQEVNFSNANLEGVDLKKTSFYRCKLRGANLKNAKGVGQIDYADFTNADLRGAYLIEMKDYNTNSAKFRNAKYNRKTRWPKGFDVAGSGAILVEEEEEESPAPEKKKSPKPTTPKDEESDSPEGDKAESNRPKDAPAEAVVKRHLEKFWAQTGVKNSYEYKSIKYGPPRKGDFRTDGVKANSNTVLYPVRVICEQTVEFDNGATRTSQRAQVFNFFKNEFDEWTFRFFENLEQ